MSVKIRSGDGSANTKEKTLWARRVADHFERRLPDLRLLVFLDSVEWYELKQCAGDDSDRGVFHPIGDRYYQCMEWPMSVKKELVEIIWQADNTFKKIFGVDAVIYLHGSTCTTEESLTMTLAHEIQHFIQYGSNRLLWAWNCLLNLAGAQVASLGFESHDLPSESEARIVAKAASEIILGRLRTGLYVAQRLRESQTANDKADWTFISGIDTAMAYDYAAETRRFYKRLLPIRDALTMTLDDARMKLPDFERLKIDEMLAG